MFSLSSLSTMESERDKTFTQIRPIIAIEPIGEQSDIQKFQDTVLRPILKLQNEFFLQLAGHTLLVRHPDWNLLSDEKKVVLLSSWVSKDPDVKKQIEGAIIGLMTRPELAFYFENEKEIQRRIRAFVLERIKNGKL